MDVTVLICTYNRAADLARTLDKMMALTPPPSLQWEILVADNNSNDGTREVVRERESKLPLRYHFEPRQGKSNALNSAVEIIHAPLIVMTDDDVDVSPDWLTPYVDAVRAHPDADFFGGKVMTKWDVQPPRWITENIDWLKSITRYDYGEQPAYLKDHRDLFVGANMAIRKKVFDLGYRFHTGFGPIGNSTSTAARHGGEEGEFEERIMRDGMKGAYVPTSIVYHRERPYRLTRKYIRWYFRETGREKRMRDGVAGLSPFWFGIPRYLWRIFVNDVLRYLGTRASGSSRVWLRAECDLARTLGDMMECRAMNSSSGKEA